jgi:hypothetical protein
VAVELPSGTATFLFCDIEESAPCGEQELEATSATLARHDGLRTAVNRVERGSS